MLTYHYRFDRASITKNPGLACAINFSINVSEKMIE